MHSILQPRSKTSPPFAPGPIPLRTARTASGSARTRFVLCVLTGAIIFPCAFVRAEDTRDLTWFLRRLRSVEHLPELEASQTSLASTWDRSGGNEDGKDFKRIEGPRNILLDVDGPGCIHRIFVGHVGAEVAKTNIQFFLDGAGTPAIDMPVEKFFDDRHGPIPYPLVFHKTYPGTLMPIPFARHCRVQLHNEQQTHWGQYWQITYTTYAPDTKVQTLVWPPSPGEFQEMQAVGSRWLEAEKTPPPVPTRWTGEKRDLVAPHQHVEVAWQKMGVIKQWRLSIDPETPELLQQIRLQMYWDGAEKPSVDAPVASFFGYAPPATGEAHYESLVLGITGGEAFCCFPMPFADGARLVLTNHSDRPIKVALRWDSEAREKLPPAWGRFHATYRAAPADLPDSPRLGPGSIPVHVALDRKIVGGGKYVGLMLQVIWPWPAWWGEGDWLIWTDEADWPPRYHGTGSEEYFNSGWCKFDRKAVSGFVATKAFVKSVYSFHLNDCFQFQRNIRVAVETTGPGEAQKLIAAHHPIWSTTSYWYCDAVRRAGSTEQVYLPSHQDYVRKALASQPATRTASAPSTASAPAH